MNDTPHDTELLTGREVANRLGVATKTIIRWRKTGLIEALQLPDGSYRYSLPQIVAALGGLRRAGS